MYLFNNYLIYFGNFLMPLVSMVSIEDCDI